VGVRRAVHTGVTVVAIITVVVLLGRVTIVVHGRVVVAVVIFDDVAWCRRSIGIAVAVVGSSMYRWSGSLLAVPLLIVQHTAVHTPCHHTCILSTCVMTSR